MHPHRSASRAPEGEAARNLGQEATQGRTVAFYLVCMVGGWFIDQSTRYPVERIEKFNSVRPCASPLFLEEKCTNPLKWASSFHNARNVENA